MFRTWMHGAIWAQYISCVLYFASVMCGHFTVRRCVVHSFTPTAKIFHNPFLYCSQLVLQSFLLSCNHHILVWITSLKSNHLCLKLYMSKVFIPDNKLTKSQHQAPALHAHSALYQYCVVMHINECKSNDLFLIGTGLETHNSWKIKVQSFFFSS